MAFEKKIVIKNRINFIDLLVSDKYNYFLCNFRNVIDLFIFKINVKIPRKANFYVKMTNLPFNLGLLTKFSMQPLK